jgi:hypothetical protein
MKRGKELILHSTAFTGVGDRGGFIPIDIETVHGWEGNARVELCKLLYESV